jgi:hypothetical protein
MFFFFAYIARFLGKTETVDLAPNGADTIVTNENRGEFVRLYVQDVLVDSVQKVLMIPTNSLRLKTMKLVYLIFIFRIYLYAY